VTSEVWANQARCGLPWQLPLEERCGRQGRIALISGGCSLIRTHQEGAQCSIGLVRRFFRKEMPAVEWASPHVVGPTSPEPQRVVPLLESAVFAPKHEDRAVDAPSLALVSFVLLEVERGRRPILFADRVDCLGISQSMPVLGAHLIGKCPRDHAPAIQGSFEDRLGRTSDETLRQGYGCANRDQGQKFNTKAMSARRNASLAGTMSSTASRSTRAG
jgi:hypothetical protein